MSPVYVLDEVIGFIERSNGAWFAYFRPDYCNPDSEETEAVFARKRDAENWVRQQATDQERNAVFAALSPVEKDTVDWLITLTPKEQRHEAANDPSAFERLAAKMGRYNLLDGSATRLAREKNEARARVSRAGCGALLAL